MRPLTKILPVALLAACAAGRNDFAAPPGGWEHRVERTDTASLELVDGGTLNLVAKDGGISVEVVDAPGIQIEARLEALANSEDEAQAALDNAIFGVTEEFGGYRFELRGAGSARTSSDKSSTRIGYRVRVPAGTRIVAKTNSGLIVCSGPLSLCDATSSYGDIAVSGTRGPIVIKADRGDVSVSEASGPRMDVTTSFGDVRISGSRTRTINASTRTGAVDLSDLESERVEVAVNDGDLTLVRIGGEIDARTTAGSILVEEGAPASSRLIAGSGEITVKGASGSLTAETTSGSIRVSDFDGVLFADSGGGLVAVSGVFRGLTAKSGTGDVRVTAGEGSVVERGWELSSALGNVIVSAPDDLAFRLDATSGRGELSSAFPLAMEAGALRDERVLRGSVNGGGETVTIEASIGNIELKRLEPSSN